ncbi:MAG: DUF5659 domain-containing protein [Patescibacteria group bacterium]|jgi:hypothetical protein
MKPFSTQDFYISCVLKAAGLQLQNLIHNSNGKVTFVFGNPNQIAETTIQKHWNKELRVISLDLVEAINQLKTRIHSGV